MDAFDHLDDDLADLDVDWDALLAPVDARARALNSSDICAIYDSELLCPICCDLCVSTQVGNPCGHSYCASCACAWIVHQKHYTCPICRTKLSRSQPMIPNIALDNLVEQHIYALALAGDKDWEVNGNKYNEWHMRNSEAKKTIGQIQKHPPSVSRTIFIVEEEEDDVELVPQPVRRRPARRAAILVG